MKCPHCLKKINFQLYEENKIIKLKYIKNKIPQGKKPSLQRGSQKSPLGT